MCCSDIHCLHFNVNILYLMISPICSVNSLRPVVSQAGGYPSFLSRKLTGVFLINPGWDAISSQGYQRH